MILRVGDKGPEVGNWQRFLRDLGYTDAGGRALVVDEDFGARTYWASKNYQLAERLTPNGDLDGVTRTLAELHGFLPFVQAKNYTKLWPARRAAPTLIVIHTMENQEKPKAAMNVAQWFAGSSAPQASAHFCIDDRSTIQCVRESDVAWAAPGGNKVGIHLEHTGYASQTPLQWADDYSRAVLERSAELAAQLSRRYQIPVAKLTPTDLKAGDTNGFCGHFDLTIAFQPGGHCDPGPSFPWDSYLARVRELLAQGNRP